jgi:hypothetical protein
MKSSPGRNKTTFKWVKPPTNKTHTTNKVTKAFYKNEAQQKLKNNQNNTENSSKYPYYDVTYLDINRY